MLRHVPIVVLCLVSLVDFVRGQEAPRIRSFAPADYHDQNQNWSLAQSAKTGWMYAGNNGGILEFDGARWQAFSMPEKQTVRTVAIGKHGEVFCGGFAEFGFWQTGSDGRLAYHSLSAQVNADRLGKEEIWHILIWKEFVLFQSFSTIYKYDYEKVTVLQPPSSIMFARVIDGRVLVPVIERGVYELLPDNTFRFLAGTETLADKIVQFLVSDGAGGIWAGTTNHGIYQISTDGRCQPWQNPLNATFRQYQLNKAISLNGGGWAIGTILSGAYILDAAGKLRFHLNRENGLQNNTVLALCEDRNGNLWLGLDRGIDLAVLRSPLTFIIDQKGKIGTVYTAARWNGLLYIGTNQGVFIRTSTGFDLVDGTQGQVWQLEVFGNQLLCGHNAGTYRIAGRRAYKISEVTGGWCTVPAPGHLDVLVQGTYTGLVVFRQDTEGNWQFSNKIDGADGPLKKIVFDASGNLWAAHPNKGLFRFRLGADFKQIREYQAFNKGTGLPADFQLDIAKIQGRLILNAHGAPLSVLDEEGSTSFVSATPDYRRQKWLSGYGDDFFAVDSSGVSLYSNGMEYPFQLSLVPNFENVVALGPEEYLFCLENGFALLDRKKISIPPGFPSSGCVLRLIELPNGSSLQPTENQIFPYKSNNLKFTFTTASFEKSPLFSWRMDGFSGGWSPWQSNPEKEFINLPAGKYRLRVRSDAGGPEATLSFRIASPWYLSGWALFGYSLLLLALVLFGESRSRVRLEQQRKQLEADKQAELTRHRGDAEREKLALEVENKSRELSNAALNLIRKNEILQRLRNDLQGIIGDTNALQKLTRLIDRHLEGDHDWEVFEESFNRVHDDFFKRLMHDFPELTPGDLRLAAYLKMNLSSKEIAPLLNISVRGVENKRYRLRKKLGLPEDSNLTEYIIGY